MFDFFLTMERAHITYTYLLINLTLRNSDNIMNKMPLCIITHMYKPPLYRIYNRTKQAYFVIKKFMMLPLLK